MHFLKLRLDSHAQYEIRVYAEAIAEIVKKVAPITWEAFTDYVLLSRNFSRQELQIIISQLSQNPNWEELAKDQDFDKLEAQEFAAKLDGLFMEK